MRMCVPNIINLFGVYEALRVTAQRIYTRVTAEQADA